MGDRDLARYRYQRFRGGYAEATWPRSHRILPRAPPATPSALHTPSGARLALLARLPAKGGVRNGNDRQRGRTGCYVGPAPRTGAGVPRGEKSYGEHGKRRPGAGKRDFIMKTLIVEDDFTSRLLLQELLKPIRPDPHRGEWQRGSRGGASCHGRGRTIRTGLPGYHDARRWTAIRH